MEPGDVKRARKLRERDPERAIELLERHPLPADTGGKIPQKMVEALEWSDMRLELYERCGRHADAEAERAAAARVRYDLDHPIANPIPAIQGAQKLREKDAAAALALLDDYPSTLRYRPSAGATLALLRAELNERCGRQEAAATERAAATRWLEQWLRQLETAIADLEPGGEFTSREWDLIISRGQVLEHLGRPTEGARSRLLAADLLLASEGDVGASANLAGTAWEGVKAFEPPQWLSDALGQAFGIVGGAFSAGYRKGASNAGFALNWQRELVQEGRAIALAQCERCGGVVEAALPEKVSRLGRCVAGHHVVGVRVVAMEDAPAAWYSDPWGRYSQRRWDGTAWTSEVKRDGTPMEDSPGDR